MHEYRQNLLNHLDILEVITLNEYRNKLHSILVLQKGDETKEPLEND
jgi:hypothetical protein